MDENTNQNEGDAEFTNGAHRSMSNRRGRNFTSNQLDLLQESFNNNHYLTRQERERLSFLLDVTERRVQLWFQYKRMKTRAAHLDMNTVDNSQCAMPPMRTVAVPSTRSTRIMAAAKCNHCGHYADHRIPVSPTVGDRSNSCDGNGCGGDSDRSRSCPCVLKQEGLFDRTTQWTSRDPPPHYVPNRTPYECEMRVAGAMCFISVFGNEFLQQSLTAAETSSSSHSPTSEEPAQPSG